MNNNQMQMQMQMKARIACVNQNLPSHDQHLTVVGWIHPYSVAELQTQSPAMAQ